MIIVPSFAEAQQRDPPVVAGIVTRGEAAAAPHMGRGVDQPSRVQAEDDAKGAGPQEQRQSADGIKHDAERDRRNPEILVGPTSDGAGDARRSR